MSFYSFLTENRVFLGKQISSSYNWIHLADIYMFCRIHQSATDIRKRLGQMWTWFSSFINLSVLWFSDNLDLS